MDIVLQNGRVIDPATGRDEIADVGITAGRIAAIGRNLAPATQIIDCTGRLVIAGMIDTHGHVYQYVTGKFGLNADMVGVRSAVTTVVDQGGPSCMTIGGFRHFIAEPAKTRVLCFISAYLVGGLEGHLYPDLYSPAQVNVAHTVRAARENADLVRGIKAHAEIGGASRWGLDVIRLGKEIARGANLPLYIHLGQLWPVKDGVEIDADELVRALIPIMERRAGPPVHAPPGRLHLDGNRAGASGGVGSAGARRDSRCRARFAFQLRDGAPRAGRRHSPLHTGRGHARL
jgi:dihydroorotase